ncbi:hypothetical protein FJ658_08290 [Schumannella sp. 10F1B-5-1]|nr:hypothetical protein FJ658_08290 [Schumannella sp. 10F1B-5-1]
MLHAARQLDRPAGAQHGVLARRHIGFGARARHRRSGGRRAGRGGRRSSGGRRSGRGRRAEGERRRRRRPIRREPTCRRVVTDLVAAGGRGLDRRRRRLGQQARRRRDEEPLVVAHVGAPFPSQMLARATPMGSHPHLRGRNRATLDG